MRREPIEVRKATLASILRKARHGVRLNEHLEHPYGLIVFQHACRMGLEGIVSKRLGSRYRSGRSPDWLKFKNPSAPAVKREAEEDWGKGEMAMIPDERWRLEDMKFHERGGKRRSVLGPVVVVESGGKYSVTMASNDLRTQLERPRRKTGRPGTRRSVCGLKRKDLRSVTCDMCAMGQNRQNSLEHNEFWLFLNCRRASGPR